MNRSGRTGLGMVLVAVLLALPMTAQAQAAEVDSIVLDLFQDIPLQQIRFTNACPGGTFQVDEEAQAFTFLETPPVDQDPVTGGYLSEGCGTARYGMDLPEGVDHMHLRFFASREVDEFQIGNIGVNAPGRNFVQELRVEDANGEILYQYAYFDTNASTQRSTYIDPPSFVPVAGTRHVEWVWTFQDLGVDSGPTDSGLLSGEQYSATIRMPQVEISGVPPAAATIEKEVHREGRYRFDEVHARATIRNQTLSSNGVAIRAVGDDRLELRYVVFPDGSRFDETATRGTDPGVLGIDPTRILIERFSDQLQVTLPKELVQQHGPGDYTFVFSTGHTIGLSPWLVPFAAVLVFAPLPFAFVADRQARVFQREAFGAYARTAYWLRTAILLVLAYYFVVLGSASLGGRLDLMIVWPVPWDAWLLYVQVAVAVAAFVVLWLVARTLYGITRPSEHHAS